MNVLRDENQLQRHVGRFIRLVLEEMNHCMPSTFPHARQLSDIRIKDGVLLIWIQRRKPWRRNLGKMLQFVSQGSPALVFLWRSTCVIFPLTRTNPLMHVATIVESCQKLIKVTRGSESSPRLLLLTSRVHYHGRKKIGSSQRSGPKRNCYRHQWSGWSCDEGLRDHRTTLEVYSRTDMYLPSRKSKHLKEPLRNEQPAIPMRPRSKSQNFLRHLREGKKNPLQPQNHLLQHPHQQLSLHYLRLAQIPGASQQEELEKRPQISQMLPYKHPAAQKLSAIHPISSNQPCPHQIRLLSRVLQPRTC